jgi:hypothetical protein
MLCSLRLGVEDLSGENEGGGGGGGVFVDEDEGL